MITYVHNDSNIGEFIIDCQNDAQEELKALMELMRTLPEREFKIEGHFFRCFMPGFTIQTNKGEVCTFFQRDGDEGNEYKLYTEFRLIGYYDYLRRPYYCQIGEFTINNLKKIEGYIEKELNEAEKIFTKAMYNGMSITRGTKSWANIVKWSEKS